MYQTPNQLEVISLFAQFAVRFLPAGGNLIEAATEACSEGRREEAINFFQRHGFDGAVVTGVLLEQCAQACGWHKSVLRPRNTFKDMLECIKQYGDGLVTEGELIMAVQMVPHQVVACSLYNQLPFQVYRKASLADWDESIASAAEKGTPPKAL
jgi:hypothetical protein